MPASICSTFHIVVDQTLNAGATASVTVTTPPRSFRVVQVFLAGVTNSTVTLRKNTGAGAVIASGIINAASTDGTIIELTTANASCVSTDNLFLAESNNQNCTRIVIVCEAHTPATMLVT